MTLHPRVYHRCNPGFHLFRTSMLKDSDTAWILNRYHAEKLDATHGRRVELSFGTNRRALTITRSYKATRERIYAISTTFCVWKIAAQFITSPLVQRIDGHVRATFWTSLSVDSYAEINLSISGLLTPFATHFWDILQRLAHAHVR